MIKTKLPAYKTIVTRRTIRKFKQKDIPGSALKKLINSARLAPSAANLQPLEYIIVTKGCICEKIFSCLRWAAYIAPKGTPAKKDAPVAYIAVLVNRKRAIAKYAAYDVGAAIQNIILSAWEQGIGACWMQAIDKKRIKSVLKINSSLKLDSIISLGYRNESPVTEELKKSVRYYKDKKDKLHVPKRKISEIYRIV